MPAIASLFNHPNRGRGFRGILCGQMQARMENEHRERRRLIALLFVMVNAGCGSANLLSSSDEPAIERGRSLSVTTFQNSANVSDVAGLQLSFESQSAATATADGVVIAYRAGDPDFTSYLAAAAGHEDQRVCPGASQLGYSVGKPPQGPYTRQRLAPPENVSVLWGPVAVTRFRGGVYASALSSPTDRFQALANDGECLRTSNDETSSLPRSLEDSGALAGACLFRLSNAEASCFRRDNHVFQGGSLAATEDYVYAAYRDVTAASVALYRAAPGRPFAEVVVPASGVDSDVLVVASGSRLFLAYRASTELRLLAYDESTRQWDAPVIVGQDLNRRHVPGRRGRPELGVHSFTLGLLGGEPQKLAIFWHRRVGRTKRTTLRGVICDATPGGVCRAPRHLSLSNARDHFLPSIASVARPGEGGTVYRHLLSYWTEPWRRRGPVTLNVAEFDEHRLRARRVVGGEQWPCPMLGAAGFPDWGGADASFVTGQGTRAAVAYRVFTDSTQELCDARDFRATPQHISVIALPEF